MQQIVTLALTIFYVVWLCAMLGFLWMIWRTSVRRSDQLEKTLTDAMLTTAEAAHKSAEAARLLAERHAHLIEVEGGMKQT